MDEATAMCLVCCVLFVPFVLHSVGLFTPNWGSNSTCDAIGLLYSCCLNSNGTESCGNTDGGDELDVRVLGLQATSFGMMFLAVVCFCWLICGFRDLDEKLVGGVFTIVLFLMSGLFNTIGCIIVATIFNTSELGYSFILSLTSGCFNILFTIIFTCVICIYLRTQYKILTKAEDEVLNKSTDV